MSHKSQKQTPRKVYASRAGIVAILWWALAFSNLSTVQHITRIEKFVELGQQRVPTAETEGTKF